MSQGDKLLLPASVKSADKPYAEHASLPTAAIISILLQDIPPVSQVLITPDPSICGILALNILDTMSPAIKGLRLRAYPQTVVFII